MDPYLCYALQHFKDSHLSRLSTGVFCTTQHFDRCIHMAATFQNTYLPMSTGDSDLVTPRGLNPSVLMGCNISCNSASLIKL